MKEELLKLSNQLENVTATLAEIVEKETLQGEISFTRSELKELLNSFHDSVVDQATSNDKIWSYSTHVATIKGDELHQLGWWSVTTQKHINYVANELNLKLIK